MNYKSCQSHIHLIARALMVSGDNLIFCYSQEKDWLFLPGGHVEDGESARQALARELEEELGAGNYPIGELLGVSENVFSPEDGWQQHEINLVFQVNMPAGFVPVCQEKHIGYVVIPRQHFSEHNILPSQFQAAIPRWLDGEGFRFFDLAS